MPGDDAVEGVAPGDLGNEKVEQAGGQGATGTVGRSGQIFEASTLVGVEERSYGIG